MNANVKSKFTIGGPMRNGGHVTIHPTINLREITLCVYSEGKYSSTYQVYWCHKR